MTAEIKDGKLVITLPVQKPYPSKSGKTLVIATTNGFMSDKAAVDGKTVKISVNAIIGR